MRPASASADRRAAAALRHVQSRFLAALREPDGATAATDAGLFLDPLEGGIARRWAVYRSAYLARLVEAIGNDFPAIVRITGAPAFRELCRRYVTVHPPSAHDIGRAGERFPDYLPVDPIATALPFLPDLARFEWALADAVGAPDLPALAWSQVVAIPAGRLADAPLTLMPSTTLIDSRWPLPSLWLVKNQPSGAIDIPLEGRPSVVLVSRRGLEPVWRTIGPDERAVVEGASRGATPTGLLAAGTFGDGAEAPPRFAKAFHRVVSYGALLPFPSALSGAAESGPRSKENP